MYHLLKDLQRKAARIVASKCALAARVDSFHESARGEAGQGQLNKVLAATICIVCNATKVWVNIASLLTDEMICY